MQCFMKKEDNNLIDVEHVETTCERCCHLKKKKKKNVYYGKINNNTMLYMISFATETPIKTCNMSLAWEPPYIIMI